MDKQQKKMLQELKPEIIKTVKVDAVFAPLEDECNWAHIRATENPHEQTTRLVEDLLNYGNSQSFAIFTRALQKPYPDLAKQLQPAVPQSALSALPVLTGHISISFLVTPEAVTEPWKFPPTASTSKEDNDKGAGKSQPGNSTPSPATPTSRKPCEHVDVESVLPEHEETGSDSAMLSLHSHHDDTPYKLPVESLRGPQAVSPVINAMHGSSHIASDLLSLHSQHSETEPKQLLSSMDGPAAMSPDASSSSLGAASLSLISLHSAPEETERKQLMDSISGPAAMPPSPTKRWSIEGTSEEEEPIYQDFMHSDHDETEYKQPVASLRRQEAILEDSNDDGVYAGRNENRFGKRKTSDWQTQAVRRKENPPFAPHKSPPLGNRPKDSKTAQVHLMKSVRGSFGFTYVHGSTPGKARWKDDNNYYVSTVNKHEIQYGDNNDSFLDRGDTIELVNEKRVFDISAQELENLIRRSSEVKMTIRKYKRKVDKRTPDSIKV